MNRHEFRPDAAGDCREECHLPRENLRAHYPSPPAGEAVSLPAGRDARDAGMEQALNAGTVEEWRPTAQAVLRNLARSGNDFTADDLVAAAGLPNASEPNSNNALGGLFAGASRVGLIERTGVMVESRRVVGHARRIPVWRGKP